MRHLGWKCLICVPTFCDRESRQILDVRAYYIVHIRNRCTSLHMMYNISYTYLGVFPSCDRVTRCDMVFVYAVRL